jgi:hypothetical protein
MPLVAVVTIVLGALLVLALVAAVAVIVLQLRRTSTVLADIDAALAVLPPGLSPLAPTIARINRALAGFGAYT